MPLPAGESWQSEDLAVSAKLTGSPELLQAINAALLSGHWWSVPNVWNAIACRLRPPMLPLAVAEHSDAGCVGRVVSREVGWRGLGPVAERLLVELPELAGPARANRDEVEVGVVPNDCALDTRLFVLEASVLIAEGAASLEE